MAAAKKPKSRKKRKPGRPKEPPTFKLRSRKITEARIETFLKVLAKTGSKCAAARAATPWSPRAAGGLQGFVDYAERCPDFKEAMQFALQYAQGQLEEEVIRRAMEPTERPIVSQGEIIGTELKYDNHLLLRVLQWIDPERWSNRQELQHSGEVKTGVMLVPGVIQDESDWEKKHGKAG